MRQSKPTRQRVRRSRSQIAGLLHSFSESGITVKEFCAAHQINLGTFQKWQSKNNQPPAGNVTRSGFSELEVDWSSGSSLFAEVRGIKIYQRVGAAYLKSLLS